MASSAPEQTPPASHETAAAHMVTGFPTAHMDTPVDAVIHKLRGRKFACADTIFVTDKDGRLEGIVRINDLLSDGSAQIGDIMEAEHDSVPEDADQEQIAMLAIRLNMIAVPVVDKDERLIGVVPPEALFRILRQEHMEDLQRLAGISLPERGAEVALDASLFDRFRRRMPWLLFGLAASSIITFVMAGFEEAISHNIAAAFFVPALVYIAGAIGTQAVSVSVRGLSRENVQIGKLLRDELVIGTGVGATLGSLSAIAVQASFQHSALSLAVGMAVFAGGLISALVGFALPWIFQRFGSDPALGSGPVCTIIQDAASLFIYFLLISTFVI
ncbi:magnesium transporter [Thalassospiraceae bacterium LMO-JJ14]|nr:magnesium transporter [Thalassospiraceae bacterium LMO-JJ14]